MTAIRCAILSFDQPAHACAQLRLLAPMARAGMDARWLAPDGTRADVRVDPADLREADVLVLQRFFPCPATLEILENVFAAGRPVVFEIDDQLLELPASNPHAGTARWCAPQVREVLSRADLVTVSTPALAEALRPHAGDRLRVVPNGVDPALFRPARPRPASGEPLTIAYFGTPTHAQDLSSIEPALLRLAAERGAALRWLFAGCCTPALAELPQARVENLRPEYAAYASWLSTAQVDIGLAPLVDLPSNRCKSAIKWFEYGACGIPGVFSDLRPYAGTVEHRRTGWLARAHPREWYEALEALIDGPELRQRMADEARARVLEAHTLEHTTRRLAETYGELFEARTGATRRAPAAARPAVSVIVPVFERIDLTRICVTALLEHTAGDRVELIVVDDGSRDGTAAWLESLGHQIVRVRHEQNRGFAAACNSGAERARGEHLVFLNNDTRPPAGWLAPLVGRAEADPRTGVVGARLLYADGRIQHAGLAFSRSGLPFHMYCGGPSDLPAAGRARELQAVTGACMLVRRAAFEAAGGFDASYRNGSEDVDLCLRLRREGWRVFYEPACTVTHLESQTPGRKDHDAANTRLFLERWKDRVVPDETRLLLEDDWICEWSGGRGQTRPLRDAAERERWGELARLEALLEREGGGAPTGVAIDAARFPQSAEVQAWVRRVLGPQPASRSPGLPAPLLERAVRELLG